MRETLKKYYLFIFIVIFIVIIYFISDLFYLFFIYLYNSFLNGIEVCKYSFLNGIEVCKYSFLNGIEVCKYSYNLCSKLFFDYFKLDFRIFLSFVYIYIYICIFCFFVHDLGFKIKCVKKDPTQLFYFIEKNKSLNSLGDGLDSVLVDSKRSKLRFFKFFLLFVLFFSLNLYLIMDNIDFILDILFKGKGKD